jgi:hypothetical protein
MTIRWTTSAASDTRVEYAAEHPPYASTNYAPQLTQNHFITISNLQPHTMYHYRVSSARVNWRSAVSRDLVVCTRPATSNLLVNPGFEEGPGPSPRSTIPGWTKSGGLDIQTSDGTWFWSLPPAEGLWLLQGAVNGSSSDAHIFQRITGVKPGHDCTFSASVMTAHRENGTFKYDVWQDQGRLSYMRLGIDPTGGTNASAGNVQWTPRMYSHRHYTQLAKTVKAAGSNITVFLSMKGQGGEWHNYAVDSCALTQEEIPTRLLNPIVSSNGMFQATIFSRANRSNIIEASASLADWSVVTNLHNATGLTPFTTPPTSLRRFYRVWTP